MADIKFYDFELNLLHIDNAYSSVDWLLKFNDIGTFEAYFPINSPVTKLCMENEYIIAVQGDNQAVITGKKVSSDLTLYGRTPNWFLSKRVTPNFALMYYSPEFIAKQHVAAAMEDVSNFKIVRTSGFTTKIRFWRNVYNPTIKVVSECLARVSAGHKMWFDIGEKKLKYCAVKPSDTGLIISRTNLNAQNLSYTDDFQDSANGGYYEVTDESTGETSWTEIASDKTGLYRWVQILGGDNEYDAKASLKSKSRKKDVKFDVRDLTYGKDYSLGDIVTVNSEFGGCIRSDRKQITEVNIWYENGNSGEKPVFSDTDL